MNLLMPYDLKSSTTFGISLLSIFQSHIFFFDVNSSEFLCVGPASVS